MRRLTVLVTRPEPGASKTAAAIRARGHDAHCLPLTEIVALSPDRWPDPAELDGLVATSANAFRHLPDAARNLFRSLPLHVGGEATAGAARQAGFEEVLIAEGDAAALADQILAGTPRRLLYLAGRVRRPNLEEKLREGGNALQIVEVYDTRPRPILDEQLKRLQEIAFDAVLLTSTETARLFAGLSGASGLAADAPRLCLSRRIAEMGGAPALVSKRPDEESLLALLDRLAGP